MREVLNKFLNKKVITQEELNKTESHLKCIWNRLDSMSQLTS